MIIKILMRLGIVYDPTMGDQVPAVRHEPPPKQPTKPKAKEISPSDWEARSTQMGASFFQRPDQEPGVDMAYTIRGSQPLGKTGRARELTNMDREIILQKVRSINWDTAARVKAIWAGHDGQADSHVVKALADEFSERTVREYTRCFNTALSQAGEEQKAKAMQMAANMA